MSTVAAEADGEAPQILLRYRVTPDEVREAVVWLVRKNRKIIRYFVIGLVIFPFGIAGMVDGLIHQDRNTTSVGMVVAVCGGYFVGWAVLRFTGRNKRLRRLRPADHDACIAFSPAGVWRQTPDQATQTAWGAWGTCNELANVYVLLGQNRRNSMLVPKRAFTDARTEAAFRQLLQTYTAATLR